MNELRVQNLLEDFQDDVLNEDECRELMEWFDEDVSHSAGFVDELRVANALAALRMVESEIIPLAVRDSLDQSKLATDISQNVRRRIEVRSQTASSNFQKSNQLPSRWSPWWLATSAVAAAVIAVIVSGVFLPTPLSNDVIATIQNARKAQEIAAGDPLRGGQVLKLASGRVKINFQSGARLAVQAPAKLKLLGPNSAQLLYGVATVRVPGELKGFVLVTPHQRVTDLGTSFGVDVNSTGETAISVFEGEIELEDHRRLVSGQTVAFTSTEQTARDIPYSIDRFLDTWQVSFGVEELVGDVRVASPGERLAPGLARDSDSLLLFPEREDAQLNAGYVVDATEPGTYQRPFRKHTVNLTEDVRVDSFLLQYNPIRRDNDLVNQIFQGELHFDRPIVALILQEHLLEASDTQLALPATDFHNIFRRGINVADTVALSPDRRVLRVALNVKNGVDQIRVLVAADNRERND